MIYRWSVFVALAIGLLREPLANGRILGLQFTRERRRIMCRPALGINKPTALQAWRVMINFLGRSICNHAICNTTWALLLA
jgi:hypothetical protein